MKELEELSQIRSALAQRFPKEVKLASEDGQGAQINAELRVRLTNSTSSNEEVAAVLTSVAIAEGISFDAAVDLASSRIGMGSGAPPPPPPGVGKAGPGDSGDAGGGGGGGGGGGVPLAPPTAANIPAAYPNFPQENPNYPPPPMMVNAGPGGGPYPPNAGVFVAPPLPVLPSNPVAYPSEAPPIPLLPAHAALPVQDTVQPALLYPPPAPGGAFDVPTAPVVTPASAPAVETTTTEANALSIKERFEKLKSKQQQ